MGYKCRYCRTEHGNNKFVGFRRMGFCGCGRCNGEFADHKEVDELIRYLSVMKFGFRTLSENATKDANNCESMMAELKEYGAEKYGQDICERGSKEVRF